MIQRVIGLLISVLLVTTVIVMDGSSNHETILTNSSGVIQSQRSVSKANDFFTKNEGQWAQELYFIGTTQFGSVGFTLNSVYFNLRGEAMGHVLKYKFVDCNPVEPIGEDICSHYHNYFIGNDPEKWASNVQNFQKVRYEELWDNIDLVYYFNDEGLKYDLIVRPGGDVDDIKIKIEGVKDIFTTNEKIIIDCGNGLKILEEKPITYYSDDLTHVGSRFKLHDDKYSFDLDDYENTREIVIDPLIMSTFLGGHTDDVGRGIVTDDSGDIIIAGHTFSSDFPTTPGAYDTSISVNRDFFVTKMNSSGTALIFSTFIGGSNEDFGMMVEIDSNGDYIIVGESNSNDFPNPIGSYRSEDQSYYDIIILKMIQNGTSLSYSSIIGGSDAEHPNGLCLDKNDNPYVVGVTSSDDNFPLLSNSYDKIYTGMGSEGFLIALNNDGSALNISTFIGGGDYDEVIDIQIDSNNDIVICGGTKTIDFPTTVGAFDRSHNGYWDIFILKFDHNISRILHSTFIGGSGLDYSHALSIDDNDNIYITGYTVTSDFPTTNGAYDTIHNSINSGDCFLIKINSTLNRLIFSTFIGGSSNDEGVDIEVDDHGYSYVIGFIESSDFPTTFMSYDTSFNGGTHDMGLFKLSPNGDKLEYSTYLGGDRRDRGYGIYLDDKRVLHVTGYSETSPPGPFPFPTTPGSYDRTLAGGMDVTVSKFSLSYPSSKPRIPSGKIGDGYCNISWESPISDGGADILYYKVYRNSNMGDGELIRTVKNREFFNDTTIINGGTYYYNITAVTVAGESPSSDILEMDDDQYPGIAKSYTEMTAWTGDPFYFSYEFEDNVEVTEHYIEYWFGSGEKKNLYLTQNVSFQNIKTGSIIIPHDIENLLNYDVVLSDPSDNKVSLPRGRNISIFDNDPPELILDRSDTVIYNGGFLNVSADFRDNIEIRLIRLEIDETRVVLGDNYYVYMEYVAGEKWIAPPFEISDNAIEISYHFEISDYHGNTKVTDPVILEVFDDINPIFIEDNSDKYCYMGEIFDFSVNIDDNIGVESVRAIYQFANQSKQSVDLIHESSNVWETGINIPENPHAYGMYYHFEFEDQAGNVNSSHLNYIRIIDPIPPTYQDLTTGNPTTGDFFRFHFMFEDNIRIDKLRQGVAPNKMGNE